MHRIAIRSDVEWFVRHRTRVITSGHIADAVGTRSARGDADGVQSLVRLDHALQWNPMQLDVLPGRDMSDASREVVGDAGNRIRLVGREQPAGQLDPLHIARVIELIVETVPETNRRKLHARELPSAKTFYARAVGLDGGAQLSWGRSHSVLLNRFHPIVDLTSPI